MTPGRLLKQLGLSILLNGFWVSPTLAVDYMLEQLLEQRLGLARRGDAEAQYAVGDMYFKGRGAYVDLAKAETWFRRAAAQGHRKAEFKLGYMYLKGVGLEPDSKQAFRWISSSAEKGYSPAQFYLGQMYALGTGVPRSRTYALRWLRASVEEGYRPPKAELGKIREDLDRLRSGMEDDETQRQ